jgi:hypothetical protein
MSIYSIISIYLTGALCFAGCFERAALVKLRHQTVAVVVVDFCHRGVACKAFHNSGQGTGMLAGLEDPQLVSTSLLLTPPRSNTVAAFEASYSETVHLIFSPHCHGVTFLLL